MDLIVQPQATDAVIQLSLLDLPPQPSPLPVYGSTTIVIEESSGFLSHLFQRRRRIELEKTVADFISLLKEEGYSFAEVLQALYNYAVQEKEKINSEKHTWEIVASVLELTSFQIMIISRHPAVRHKCVFLQKTTKKFIEELQSDEYRFSEILQALSQYASQESENNTGLEQMAWNEVVTLLKLGAQQAQSLPANQEKRVLD